MTIYILSSDDRVIDIVNGYATNEEGIKQLALKWYWTGWEGDKCRTEINVDIENKTVTIYDPADGISIIYDIITFVRVT